MPGQGEEELGRRKALPPLDPCPLVAGRGMRRARSFPREIAHVIAQTDARCRCGRPRAAVTSAVRLEGLEKPRRFVREGERGRRRARPDEVRTKRSKRDGSYPILSRSTPDPVAWRELSLVIIYDSRRSGLGSALPCPGFRYDMHRADTLGRDIVRIPIVIDVFRLGLRKYVYFWPRNC